MRATARHRIPIKQGHPSYRVNGLLLAPLDKGSKSAGCSRWAWAQKSRTYVQTHTYSTVLYSTSTTRYILFPPSLSGATVPDRCVDATRRGKGGMDACMLRPPHLQPTPTYSVPALTTVTRQFYCDCTLWTVEYAARSTSTILFTISQRQCRVTGWSPSHLAENGSKVP